MNRDIVETESAQEFSLMAVNVNCTSPKTTSPADGVYVGVRVFVFTKFPEPFVCQLNNDLLVICESNVKLSFSQISISSPISDNG